MPMPAQTVWTGFVQQMIAAEAFYFEVEKQLFLSFITSYKNNTNINGCRCCIALYNIL